MKNVVPEMILTDRRLAKFRNEICEIMKSPVTFRKRIDVDKGHIAFRQSQTGQDIRGAMDNERIASIVLNGEINESRCKSAPIEIAFEGKFSELTYMTYPPVTEHKFENAAIRVIVREGSPKHVVVTIYPLNNEYSAEQISRLPEVPYDIW